MMRKPPSGGRSTVPAPQPGARLQHPRALRLLAILDAAAAHKDGVTLAQLATLLGVPKSSLLLLLKPLVTHRYLSHDLGVYRLASSSFRHANQIRANRTFPTLLRPLLTELGQSSQETVYLAVLDRAYRFFTYIDGIDSPRPVRYSVPIGSARPLYCTSGGRVLLAFQDKAWRDDYLRSTPLEKLTPQTLTDTAALERELMRIQQQGFAVSIDQGAPGAGGVAAPIWAADGLVGAFVIAVPVERLRANLVELRGLVVEVAAEATRLMGGLVSETPRQRVDAAVG
jgi:DNA-binding IclR family transcriptional regulator